MTTITEHRALVDATTQVRDRVKLPVLPALPDFSALQMGIIGSATSLIVVPTLTLGLSMGSLSAVAVVLGFLLCGIVGVKCGVSMSRQADELSGFEKFLGGASIVGGSLALGIVMLVMFVLSLFAVLAPR